MKVVDDYRLIPVSSIKLKYDNPRKIFDDEEMKELISSVKESGVLNPIWCSIEGNKYYLIAGERRLRAAKKASIKNMPSRVFSVNDEADVRALQTIENEQRADLSQEERFQQLLHMKELGLSIQDMSKMTGKNSTVISGLLGLEQLNKDIFNRTDIGDFGKTQIAKLREDEQKIIADKLASESITSRQLYDDVLRNLRKLDRDDSVSEAQREKIRKVVIHRVDRDIKAKNIIGREKVKIEMIEKGEIPKVLDDNLVEKYLSDTNNYHRVLDEMSEAHVELANQSLVSKLAISLASLYSGIGQLIGRIEDE